MNDIIERLFSGYDRRLSVIEEKLSQLVTLSGKSVDELIWLFAKGYTLSPPDQSITMADLNRELRLMYPEPWERHMAQRFMKED